MAVDSIITDRALMRPRWGCSRFKPGNHFATGEGLIIGKRHAFRHWVETKIPMISICRCGNPARSSCCRKAARRLNLRHMKTERAIMASFYDCACDNPGPTDEAETQAKMLAVLEIIRPKPSPFNLVRIGGVSDGAYLVPDDLRGIQACFSPGVNNTKDFEDQLTIEHGITCHMCDYSSDVNHLKTALIPDKQTFDKLWLEPQDGVDRISLKSWMEKYYSDAGTDFMLQMDIEGAEYRNIISADTETLSRFRYLVFEVHGLNRFNVNEIFYSVLSRFFNKVGSLFTCIHIHPNNYSNFILVKNTNIDLPDVLELTFVRNDFYAQRMAAMSSYKANVLIPHPLDINNNVNAAPIILGEFWSGGTRSIESKMKILEDEFAHQKYLTQNLFNAMNQQITGVLKAAASRSLSIETMTNSEVDLNEKTSALDEVALGQPFELSSGHPISGKITPNYSSYFFHTDLGIDESITIELKNNFVLDAILIANRNEACFDRARYLQISFCIDKYFGRNSQSHYLSMPDDFVTGVRRRAFISLPSITARYVKLSTPLHTWLHLADLRIYANPTFVIERR